MEERRPVMVLTGATSGIGLAAAKMLALSGAQLFIVGRNREKVDGEVARLGRNHRGFVCDFSNNADIIRLVDEIGRKTDQVDMLANNVGGTFASYLESVDGIEMTFAVNHLSYFRLTMGLLKLLLKSPSPRVVNTASLSHRSGRLPLPHPDLKSLYSELKAYGDSKLANVLFTRELARRFGGRGLIANCFHPGMVATSIWPEKRNSFYRTLFALSKPLMKSPEKGAEGLVFLATAKNLPNGGYFHGKKLVRPARQALDDAAAKELWEWSERNL